MKKNISINLQGLIFHIEEDGYEQLRQYLAAIKAYFSSYEGHDEIVADIEGRMAEVFSGKLNPGKQVITLEDVQALIAQMGSVQDFALLEDEEPINQAHAASSQSTGTGTGSQQYTHTVPPGSKRLFRDANNKIIGGVSAGIANYLGVDSLWIRLLFVFFFVLGVLTAGISAGFVTLVYVLCWIALPNSYTLPEVNTKKLFRDPDDKKLGGVCSGLALYFGMDVAVVRLLFLISVLFGGLGIPIYIVLWLVVPLATTITDKVQMQGNPVTLSGIEESLKNNLRMRDEDGRESNLARVLLFPVRLIAQVLEVLSKALRPFLSFLGSAIRILAGIILLVLALSFIFMLFILLGAGTGMISGHYIHGDADGIMQLFTRDFPVYGMVAGFLAGLIPSIFLLIIAVGLLTKRFFLKPLVGWSMFAVWVVSLFVMGTAIFDYRQNFNEYGEYISEKTFPVAAYPTVLLDAKDTDRSSYRDFHLELIDYAGPDIRMVQEYSAKGRTESDAIRNARMLSYRVQQRDSSLIFDYDSKLATNAVFRDQELNLKLYLPQGKRFRLSRDFINFIPSSYFENEYDYDKDSPAKAIWELRDGKFYCAQCPVREQNNENDINEDQANENDFNPDIDVDINLNDNHIIGNWNDYGPEEKTFDFDNFSGVKVGGAYLVRITKGDRFSVRARGGREGISNLRANRSGNTLELESDEDFWDFVKKHRENVLIEITAPSLNQLDLSGAIKAEISGFDENDFRISESGAVQTAIAIKANRLEVDLSGAAKSTLTGSADNLDVNASGACNLDAANFKVRTADLDLSGASKAQVYVTDKLTADASGVSKINYSGNPSTVTTDVSGASKVSKNN